MGTQWDWQWEYIEEKTYEHFEGSKPHKSMWSQPVMCLLPPYFISKKKKQWILENPTLQVECPIKIYIGNKSVWPNDHEHYVHFYNSVSLKMTSVFSKYLLGQKKLEIGLCIGFSYSLFAFMFAKSNYYDLFYNEKKYF